MKKISVFLSIFLFVSLGTYSKNINNIAQNVKNINLEYQELMLKEAEKIEEFKAEKLMLENELKILKEKLINKDKVLAKLDKDAQIRWHRDKYKKLLKDYKRYYKKLNEKIKNTEEKIAELTRLLKIMQ